MLSVCRTFHDAIREARGKVQVAQFPVCGHDRFFGTVHQPRLERLSTFVEHRGRFDWKSWKKAKALRMRKLARFFAGPVMIAAGINHFVNPDLYLKIVPAELPAPGALVYISGAAESLAALGTMFRRTRRPAGWFLIATLVAVYPANVYMAVNHEKYSSIPQWALVARLPLQFLFVYWVWLATRKDEVRSS